jgi:hypothetical protein
MVVLQCQGDSPVKASTIAVKVPAHRAPRTIASYMFRPLELRGVLAVRLCNKGDRGCLGKTTQSTDG